MSFYKTNKIEVVEALAHELKFRQELQEKAQAFAELMGADKGFIKGDLTSVKFAGIRFKTPPDYRIWRKPDDNKLCSPRTNLPAGLGLAKEDREELKKQHKATVGRYNANEPKERLERDLLFKSMGTDWGTLLFSGLGCFPGVDGFVYVETSAKLAEHMSEILGSEFHQAKEAFEAHRKAG